MIGGSYQNYLNKLNGYLLQQLLEEKPYDLYPEIDD